MTVRTRIATAAPRDGVLAPAWFRLAAGVVAGLLVGGSVTAVGVSVHAHRWLALVAPFGLTACITAGGIVGWLVKVPRAMTGRVLSGIAAGTVVGVVGTLLVVAVYPRPTPPVRTLPDRSLGCPSSPTVVPAGRPQDTDDCYGLIGLDSVTDAVFGRDELATTGRPDDPGLREIQQSILRANPPAGTPAKLTAIWLGELTCAGYTADAQCEATAGSNRHGHRTERDELEGLRLAQERWKGALRVVIADAGETDQHLARVTDLIETQDRAGAGAFGADRVVVGGGNSTAEAAAAFGRLLQSGIPVIAPTLVADLGNPGAPFLQQAGYLQLGAPIDTYARHAVETLWATYPQRARTTGTAQGRAYPRGIKLAIYRYAGASRGAGANGQDDKYTLSLEKDLKKQAGVTALPPGLDRTDVQPISIEASDVEPGGLRDDICIRGHHPDGRPTVVFFADRYYRFPSFVKEVETVCGQLGGPELVMADGSANRVMGDDDQRSTLAGSWPLEYYAGGLQCTELSARAGSDPAAARLLGDTEPALGFDCGATAGTSVSAWPVHQVGDHVAPSWDAIELAERLLADVGKDHLRFTPDGLQTLTATSHAYPLAEGTVTVQGGQADPARPDVPVIPLCVQKLNDNSSRSADACQGLLTLIHDPDLPTFSASS